MFRIHALHSVKWQNTSTTNTAQNKPTCDRQRTKFADISAATDVFAKITRFTKTFTTSENK